MAFKMKGFKPHNMYKTEKANTKADHDRLEKQGFDHSPYDKALVGNQHELPEFLQKEIKNSPAKKYKSDAQRKAVHASKAESGLKKTVSWMYGGKKYSGKVIRETKDKIFARTHNNKVKTIVKGKTKRS